MSIFYLDYYWKKGTPVGFTKIQDNRCCQSAYKIMTDPYKKRYTIEKYHFGLFQEVIYDSQCLDFRKLTLTEQMGWQREILQENDQEVQAIIRNIEERVIFIEKYSFKNGLCRECKIFSLQNNHLATQKMLYEQFTDPFNGVIFLDTLERKVLKKIYDVNKEGHFSRLIQEEWNFSPKL